MRHRTLAAVAALTLFAGACSIEGLMPEEGDEALPTVSLNQDASPAPRSELADVIEKALPSVVNVKVTGFEGRGEGSGVVIDPKGIILTNSHVVCTSLEVRIFFNDGRDPLRGRVVGLEPERDLAVVRVAADDLTALPLGKSEGLRLGDEVIAIGFPLGLGGPTVTRGIVSGLDRTIEAQGGTGLIERLVGLLQTDAAINPGNSGGALIDGAGRLVGINTAVAGSAENIGFAIAIDEALPVVEEILSEPPERRAWLGVTLLQAGSTEADALGVDLDEGAVVTDLVREGPAEEAGIEPPEVIVSIEGRDIVNVEDVTRALADFDPGDPVSVELVDPEGDRRTVTVELQQRPANLDVINQDECP